MGAEVTTKGGNRSARLRRYLTAREVRAAHAAIELERVRDAWGVRGWSVVGVSPRIRVQVHVDVMLARPPVPASTIPLPSSIGNGRLKVAVVAPHAHLPRRLDVAGDSGRPQPGAPIRVVSGAFVARAVVAAFDADDNDVYLITCGHTFPDGGGHIEVDHQRVAEVSANALFDQRDPTTFSGNVTIADQRVSFGPSVARPSFVIRIPADVDVATADVEFGELAFVTSPPCTYHMFLEPGEYETAATFRLQVVDNLATVSMEHLAEFRPASRHHEAGCDITMVVIDMIAAELLPAGMLGAELIRRAAFDQIIVALIASKTQEFSKELARRDLTSILSHRGGP
jgi:hypothetical protein